MPYAGLPDDAVTDDAVTDYEGLPEGYMLVTQGDGMSAAEKLNNPYFGIDTPEKLRAEREKDAPIDGVPKWGRDNPNLYAGAMTALDMAPAIASFAKGTGVGIPVAGAINTAAKAAQRAISGEDQSLDASLEDFVKGATIEGAGRGLGKIFQGITDIPAIRQGADSLSKKLYQSAMKFSTSPTVLPATERAAITETGLKNNFMPRDEDYLRLSDMVNSNTNKVNDIISSGTAKGDIIQADDIAKSGKLSDLMDYGKKVETVAPGYQGEVKSQVGNLYKTGGKLTPDEVNTSKRQIYKELEDAYKNGDISNPRTQAKKQIGLGLKTVLADMYPEIGKLNANSKELLDLSDHLARSIGRVQNRDIIGLGDKVMMDALASIPKESMNANKTLWGAVAAAVDRPIVKAKLARVLYKANTGRNLPPSQWQKGLQFMGKAANSAPARGLFDATVLTNTNDPLGLR